MKTITIIGLYLISCCCRAQVISVSSDNNRVLYAGVENPLTIAVSNVVPKNIIVKTDNGTLNGEDGHYIFYTDTGIVANITIFNKTSNKQIGIIAFHVREIPDPNPRLGAYKSGNIPLAIIKSQSGITTDIESIYYQRGLPIISFTINILRNGDYVFKEIKNEGKVFNEEVKKAFQQLRPGDSVALNNIFAKRHDGTLTILASLTFTIK